ncbi:putative bifunctional diguanylate cyclase/phosphodiesterase [Anaerosacchariphilus polymeriproducens]|uniref:EAL domain-containing protein n=1 Tax=Anaerosacchariphilus polymeriproducens TaxID=1812858 RepID=A0A371AR67_9FIRM|nr:GGDEF and EAL domain-containing protein [Anaerosacchariphilus polymeriproducens]RDU22034.1 EAL domain-containing protein [Anaerosacchariphilus polymeriproducens]
MQSDFEIDTSGTEKTSRDEWNHIMEELKSGSDNILDSYSTDLVIQKVYKMVEKNYLERLKLEQDLEDTTIRLAALINSVPGGILTCEVSDKMKIVYCNDAVPTLWGYTKEEFFILGKQGVQSLIYEEDWEMVHEEILSAIQDNRTLEYICRIKHKDGFYPWVHVIGVKFKEENNHPIFNIVIIDVTKEKENELKFRYMAEYDSLTGIYNRDTFFRKTKEMLNQNKNEKYVLIHWDVERFKVINDLFGNKVGDEILKEIARYFEHSMKDIGIAGRLETDHFAVCFPEKYLDMDATIKQINNNFKAIHLSYEILIHAGVYFIDDISVPVNIMCDRAQLALMTVKGNYIRRYAFYDKKLRDSILGEQELKIDMHGALEKEQFEIYIQPKCKMEGKQVIGGESLVRWLHPVKGMISPKDFIPLFEKSGFIVKLDAYVWEKTCQLIAKWKKEGHEITPLSVNVSRINFFNPKLCDQLLELVQKYDIDPKYLELEVTESVYIQEATLIYGVLEKLQSLGFHILMDDFGSGYSSLNMLKDAPVDIIKLDLRFLSGDDKKGRGRDILSAVVQMAKVLRLQVIAEGVETEEQAKFLKDIQCDYAQGYYYSRPVPVDTFEKMVY